MTIRPLTRCDNARTLAKGLEDGLADMADSGTTPPIVVVPTKNLRVIIADLRQMADAHDTLWSVLVDLMERVEVLQESAGELDDAPFSPALVERARSALAGVASAESTS